MKAIWQLVRVDERGLSTAEYAVGTCAVTGLAGLLMKLLTGQDMARLIWRVLSHGFGRLFGF